MAFKFKTVHGKSTDILHSASWMNRSFAKREQNAFSKSLHKGLSHDDQLLLRGYATAVAERNNAWKYNQNKNKKNK